MSGFFDGKFVAMIAGLGAIAAIIGLAVVYFGLIPLAADKKNPRWIYHLARSTYKRWVTVNAADLTPPDNLFDEGRTAFGAQHFAQNCVRCHGPQASARAPWSWR